MDWMSEGHPWRMLDCLWRTTSTVLRSRMRQTHKEKKPVQDWFHLSAKLSLSQPFSATNRSQRSPANKQTTRHWLTQPPTWNHLCVPSCAWGTWQDLWAPSKLSRSSAPFETHFLTSQMPHVPLFPVQTWMSAHRALQCVFTYTWTRVNNHQQQRKVDNSEIGMETEA